MTASQTAIQGQLATADGTPVSDAVLVSLDGDGRIVGRAYSDINGQFQIDGAFGDGIRLEIEAYGFTATTTQVGDLTLGQTASIGTIALSSAAHVVGAHTTSLEIPAVALSLPEPAEGAFIAPAEGEGKSGPKSACDGIRDIEEQKRKKQAKLDEQMAERAKWKEYYDQTRAEGIAWYGDFASAVANSAGVVSPVLGLGNAGAVANAVAGTVGTASGAQTLNGGIQSGNATQVLGGTSGIAGAVSGNAGLSWISNVWGLQSAMQQPTFKQWLNMLKEISEILTRWDRAIDQTKADLKRICDDLDRARKNHPECDQCQTNGNGGAEGEGESDNCKKPPQPPECDDCDSDGGGGQAVGSFDPNDITGPSGSGDDHYLLPGSWMPYTIRFENDPAKATAAAQEVFITHTLDSDLDLESFELVSFGFGGQLFAIPTGFDQYETVVDYQNIDGSKLLVSFSASVNYATRAVDFTFRSIDPDTGDLPAGVLDGFLPPNHGNSVGEGFVSFIVRSDSSVTTGDQVDAQASIVFDTNAPILTNTYINKFDSGSPTSQVDTLPATTETANFSVTWTGSDDGSGAQTFDVFASTNDGAFELWLDDTSELSGVFTGSDGSTYRFYSVATDGVGHLESPPSTFDAETTLQLPRWQNPTEQLDVNGDGSISPVDVLMLINYINSNTDSELPLDGATPPPYLDPTGDGFISPLDVLLVINHLNSNPGGEGELEAASSASFPVREQLRNERAYANREWLFAASPDVPLLFHEMPGLESAVPLGDELEEVLDQLVNDVDNWQDPLLFGL